MTTPTTPTLGRIAEVLRENPSYRRLVAANLISQVGDWFSIVALFSLLLQLTGKAESVALVVLSRSLPALFIGPFAGVVADRRSRRGVMILSDLLRAGLGLLFLLIRKPEHAPLAYLLVTLQSTISTFFEPAQSALFPNLVRQQDLVVASALENTLWAVSLAVGSALGGVVMQHFGRDVTFACDALTFVGSALFLRTLPDARPPPTPEGGAHGLHALAEGLRYLWGHAEVRATILVKGSFGFTLGGVLVLLAYFGEVVWGEHGSQIAPLYTARGIGSLLGPFVAWRWVGDTVPGLRRGVSLAFLAVCLSYVAFAAAPGVAWAAVALAVANAGGSVLWTYGSSLLQLLVPDAVRGRVFAADMAWMTLTLSLSTVLTGTLLDRGVDARLLMAGCGGVALFPIVYWSLAQRGFAGLGHLAERPGPG